MEKSGIIVINGADAGACKFTTPWDDRQLGASEEHVVVASPQHEVALTLAVRTSHFALSKVFHRFSAAMSASAVQISTLAPLLQTKQRPYYKRNRW